MAAVVVRAASRVGVVAAVPVAAVPVAVAALVSAAPGVRFCCPPGAAVETAAVGVMAVAAGWAAAALAVAVVWSA